MEKWGEIQFQQLCLFTGKPGFIKLGYLSYQIGELYQDCLCRRGFSDMQIFILVECVHKNLGKVMEPMLKMNPWSERTGGTCREGGSIKNWSSYILIF